MGDAIVQEPEEFTKTAPEISRVSKVCVATVKLYKKLGFIEGRKISSGTVLFKPSAAKIVRQKLRERKAANTRNRGKTRAKAKQPTAV